MNDERIKAAYSAFRDGFRHTPPLKWDDQPAWIRDAFKVAYLQGMLDDPDTLSHSDLCLLSRSFNEKHSSPNGAEYRINEWLKRQIAAAQR